MATISHGLEALRTCFPGWSFFRSDAGAFYGSRRGVQLSDVEVDAGMQQTVSADDLETFVSLLRAQARLEVEA
ncbi:hypothetical protein ACIA8R_12730 [Nonomuraea sp. NPDC051191]|uniref:hypothetical protein n=1 Tax=Nonomuraea sp. NPDC051191 TaxID=3364372 RepID=UPI0037A28185